MAQPTQTAQELSVLLYRAFLPGESLSAMLLFCMSILGIIMAMLEDMDLSLGTGDTGPGRRCDR